MTRRIPLVSIVLVCLLSFSMFGCGERDDSVEDNLIPDAELRSEIRWSLRMDFDTLITAEDMLKLTELDAEGRTGSLWYFASYISNLTGLEYAENLVVLDLDVNHIRDVNPLKGLENLKELNLGSNSIVDVSPLAGLQSLDMLWLHHNSLVDVSPLEGLKNLHRLYLNDNDIVDISSLQGLKKLHRLDLSNNPLSADSKNLIIPIIEANGTEVLY